MELAGASVYRLGMVGRVPENLRLGRFRCYFEAEEPPVLRRIDIDSRRYARALEILGDDLASQTSDLVG